MIKQISSLSVASKSDYASKELRNKDNNVAGRQRPLLRRAIVKTSHSVHKERTERETKLLVVANAGHATLQRNTA